MPKQKKKFNSWLQRDLSLRGRALLAKAEGISRVTYPALSLFVNKFFCAEVDRMLFDFLWKNKRHYIKKSVIINSYDYGGLNFLDFSSMNNTFKINWLRQFLNDPDSLWNVIPKYIFSKVGGLPFLLVCNYNISKLPIKLSNFHKQVLLAWHLIYKHNFSPHRYYIWNNHDICYKNKSIFFPNWFRNNICLVSQLFNNNGHLLSYSEFLSKYCIPITPREFAIVMDAIPSGAITLLKNSLHSVLPVTSLINACETVIGKICFSHNPFLRNRKIRHLFQNEITSIPHVIFHWSNLFYDIPWKIVWSLPNKFLITNKVKEVSFKLLHRVYPVNVYIKKMLPEKDPLCSFCRILDESVDHLFWECTHIKIFWKEFSLFIRVSLLYNFSLSYKDVLFGFYHVDKVKDKYFLINLFILLAKFFIHKCKFLSVKPLFLIFCKDLKYYLNTISTSSNVKALKSVTLCESYNILSFL